MSRALVAGLLAGYGVAIPVGAIGALLIGLAARAPLRVAVAAALGVATVDGGYALVAVLGGGAIGRAIQPVATPTRWVAAVVLIGLAVRNAVLAVRRHRMPVEPSSDRTVTPVRAYLMLIGLTALNPATVVYFGALVLGRQASGAFGPVSGAVFVFAAFVASASWQLLLACGGSLLGRVVNTPRGRLGTTLAASALIVVLAVQLVV
ncbi:MAG TPA: LysE family transporter [Pseudonocardiaceae bacterium]|nr:LysE family transporter [Pseudonocardiaceae bacterium]